MKGYYEYLNNRESTVKPEDVRNPDQNTSIVGDMVDMAQAGAASGLGGMVDFVGLDTLADKLYGISKEQYETLTPEMKASMAKEIFKDDPEALLGFSAGEGLTDPRAIAGNLANLAGQMLPTMAIPAGMGVKGAVMANRAIKGIDGALSAVAKKEAADAIRAKIGKDVGMKSTAILAGANAASAGGQGGQDVHDQIMNASYDQLVEQPIYQDIVRSVHAENPDMKPTAILSEARTRLAKEAERSRAYDPVSLGINAIGGAIGDKFILNALSKGVGQSVAGAVTKGFLTEGATEFVQEGSDAYATNDTMREYANKDANPWDGVTAQAATGAFLGGAMGGTAGGLGRLIHGPEKVSNNVSNNETVSNDVEQDVSENVSDNQPAPEPQMAQQAPQQQGYQGAEVDLTTPEPELEPEPEVQLTREQQLEQELYERNLYERENNGNLAGFAAAQQRGLTQSVDPRIAEAQAERDSQVPYAPYQDNDPRLAEAEAERRQREIDNPPPQLSKGAESRILRRMLERTTALAEQNRGKRPTADQLLSEVDRAVDEAHKAGINRDQMRAEAEARIAERYRFDFNKIMEEAQVKPLDPMDTHTFGREQSEPAPKADTQDLYEGLKGSENAGSLVLGKSAKPRLQKKAKKKIYDRLAKEGTLPKNVNADNIDSYLEESIPNPAMRDAFFKAMGLSGDTQQAEQEFSLLKAAKAKAKESGVDSKQVENIVKDIQKLGWGGILQGIANKDTRAAAELVETIGREQGFDLPYERLDRFRKLNKAGTTLGKELAILAPHSSNARDAFESLDNDQQAKLIESAFGDDAKSINGWDSPDMPQILADEVYQADTKAERSRAAQDKFALNEQLVKVRNKKPKSFSGTAADWRKKITPLIESVKNGDLDSARSSLEETMKRYGINADGNVKQQEAPKPQTTTETVTELDPVDSFESLFPDQWNDMPEDLQADAISTLRELAKDNDFDPATAIKALVDSSDIEPSRVSATVIKARLGREAMKLYAKKLASKDSDTDANNNADNEVRGDRLVKEKEQLTLDLENAIANIKNDQIRSLLTKYFSYLASKAFHFNGNIDGAVQLLQEIIDDKHLITFDELAKHLDSDPNKETKRENFAQALVRPFDSSGSFERYPELWIESAAMNINKFVKTPTSPMKKTFEIKDFYLPVTINKLDDGSLQVNGPNSSANIIFDAKNKLITVKSQRGEMTKSYATRNATLSGAKDSILLEAQLGLLAEERGVDLDYMNRAREQELTRKDNEAYQAVKDQMNGLTSSEVYAKSFEQALEESGVDPKDFRFGVERTKSTFDTWKVWKVRDLEKAEDRAEQKAKQAKRDKKDRQSISKKKEAEQKLDQARESTDPESIREGSVIEEYNDETGDYFEWQVDKVNSDGSVNVTNVEYGDSEVFTTADLEHMGYTVGEPSNVISEGSTLNTPQGDYTVTKIHLGDMVDAGDSVMVGAEVKHNDTGAVAYLDSDELAAIGFEVKGADDLNKDELADELFMNDGWMERDNFVFRNKDNAKTQRHLIKDMKNAPVMSLEEADQKLSEWKSVARQMNNRGQKTVLSIFDSSGEWSKPYREAGFNVIQFDINLVGGNGYELDVNSLDREQMVEDMGITDVDIILAACPCTDFATSGSQWFKGKDIAGETEASKILVNKTLEIIEFFKPTHWAIENPVGRIEKSTGVGKPNLIFNPNHFGEPYTKRTHIFGSFNNDVPTAHVQIVEDNSSKAWNLSGKTAKGKFLRSLTPEQFAYAFFMANGADRSIKPNVIDVDKERFDLSSVDVPSYESQRGANDGSYQKVFMANGDYVKTEYRVVEANDLETSHTTGFKRNPKFPKELQPRDRSATSLQQQVRTMANSIEPERLGESSEVDRGAPIVRDGLVESGNGRTIALKLAYQGGKADHYKAWLKANADKFGIDIEGMEQPILVRRRLGEMDSREFVIAANESATAELTPVEQAEVDASVLTDEDLALINVPDGGNMLAGSNHEFMKRFVTRTGAELSGLMSKDGSFNKVAGQRALNAIFHKAYGQQELTKMVSEDADPDLKNVLNALTRSAAQFARLQAYPDGDMGLSGALNSAMQKLKEARQNGQAVSELVNQGTLFGDSDPVADHLAQYFDKNIRSSKRIGDVLISLGKQIEDLNKAANNLDLLGDSPKLSLLDVLNSNKEFVADEQIKQYENQTLFDQETDSGPVQGDPEPRDTQSEPEKTGRTKTSTSGLSDNYGSKNKVFTKDAADKARELLRKKRNNLNSVGIDPEVIQAGIQIAGYHIEAGARKFADFAQAMVDDLGEEFKPYLRSWYEGVRYYPGFDNKGMSSAEEIDSVDLDAIGENDVSRTNQDDERDSSDTGEQVSRPSRTASVQDERDSEGSGDSEPDPEPPTPRGGRKGSTGVRKTSTTANGKGRNQRVYSGTGSATNAELPTGSELGTGNRGSGDNRTDAESEAATRAVGAANKSRIEKQPKLSRGDLKDIKATVEGLFPEQHEDLEFIEKRLYENDKRGVHIANGTGSGKTFTALGQIIRENMAGKKDILIVVPSTTIMDEWDSAAKYLGAQLHRLESMQDGGKGNTITTYANFYENFELAKRDYDMVFLDESEKIAGSNNFDSNVYLDTFRAYTGNPKGARRLNILKHPKVGKPYLETSREIDKLKEKFGRATPDSRVWQELNYKINQKEEELAALAKELEKTMPAIKEQSAQRWGSKATRAVTMSASPFPYRKSLHAYEGYLFDYEKDSNGEPDINGFYIQHFGYGYSHSKLTEPGANVDVGFMEREFNDWLQREGALRARMTEVPFDYQRRFDLVEGGIGQKVDNGFMVIDEMRNSAVMEFEQALGDPTASKTKKAQLEARAESWKYLSDALSRNMDWTKTTMLLEAIKAQAVLPIIDEQIAEGRKVVVFHKYKEGIEAGSSYAPFADPQTPETDIAWQELSKARPEITSLFLTGLKSAMATMTEHYGNKMGIVNGNVANGKKSKAVKDFNDDNSDVKVILVQEDAGKAGISLHDKTGKTPRIIMNLNLPVTPTTLIQTEGRIYRKGLQSNAIFAYPTTGLGFEESTFSRKVASRSGTVENLAMGNQARALEERVKEAFDNAQVWGINYPGEAQGGKAADRQSAEELSQWDKAKTLYYAQLKKNARTKAQEGHDYYATPEPIGLKMVEWLDLNSGEKALEPSAGHGAISRWFPHQLELHVIEQSGTLASKAQRNTPQAKEVFNRRFEEHNIQNKYDGIAMNPPYNYPGDKSQKLAMDHLDKAFHHLRDGGRMSIIVPDGPAFQKRFDKWFEETKNVGMVAEVKLPVGAFERAGTGVRTRILVIDKLNPKKFESNIVSRTIDLSQHRGDIESVFDRLENVELPRREFRVIDDTSSPEVVLETHGLELENQGKQWHLTGDTKKHLDTIRKARTKLYDAGIKSRWDGKNTRWTFYGDPSETLAAELVDALEMSDAVTSEGNGSEGNRTSKVQNIGDIKSFLDDQARGFNRVIWSRIRDVLPEMDVIHHDDPKLPPAIRAARRENAMASWIDNYQGRSILLLDRNMVMNKDLVQTLLHELLHAVTVRKLKQFKTGNVSKKTGEAINDLKDLQRHVLNQLESNDDLKEMIPDVHLKELKDTREFITYGMTNGNVQRVLEKIEYKNKSVWSKFVSAIAKALGIKTENALTELVRVTEQIVDPDGTQEFSNNVTFDTEPGERVTGKDADDLRGNVFQSNPEKDIKTRVTTKFNHIKKNFRQLTADRYDSLMKLDRANGLNPYDNPSLSSWVRARMSSAAGGAISAFMSYGKLKWSSDGVTLDVIENDDGKAHGLAKVFQKLGNDLEVKDFLTWVAVQRAQRLKDDETERFGKWERAKDKWLLANPEMTDQDFPPYKPKYTELLFTDKQIKAGLSFNKGTMGDGRNRQKVYDEVMQEFTEYHNSILKIAEDAGIISTEALDMWSNEFYVPFNRVMDEDNETNFMSVINNGLTKQDAIKRIKGSKRQLGDILENYIDNAHRLVDASLKNKAGVHAMDQAVDIGLAEKVSKKSAGKDGVTFIMRNGKREYYGFALDRSVVTADGKTTIEGKMLLDSIQMLNPVGFSGPFAPVHRVAVGAKRLLTNWTTISPIFMARNFLRDMVSSGSLEKGGFNSIKGGKAYGLLGEMSKTKARMLASGGAFSFGHAYGDHSSDIMASVNNQLTRVPVMTASKNKLHEYWTKWHDISDTVENIHRAAVFETNLDDGLTAAAFRSRDLIDFSAHGSSPYVRFFISVIPFLNARAQSLDKLARHGTEPVRKKRLLLTILALGAVSILNHAMNYDDEDYQNLDDWQRDTYWFVRFGNDAYFIPKPFEIGAIASMFERGFDIMAGEDNGTELAKAARRAVVDTLNFNPIPQVAKPVLEVAMNRDMFRERPIENMGEQDLDPSMVYNSNTSAAAKVASSAMESVIGNAALSPKQIDHLVKGYLSFVGVTALGASDVLADLTSDVEKPDSEWFEHKLFRWGYRDLDKAPAYTRKQKVFYDLLSEYRTNAATYRSLLNRGEQDKAENYLADNRDNIIRAKAFDKTSRMISKLRRREQFIMSDKNMTATEKRQAIDAIRIQKQNLIEQTLLLGK